MEPYSEETSRRVMDEIYRLSEMAKARRQVDAKKPPVLEPLDRSVLGEEIVIPERNMFTDPQSKLNRGLGNLSENVMKAAFGMESDNPLVDYGLSNIPGVGAASILAAGGMPGIVDAVGMGELKGLARALSRVSTGAQKNALSNIYDKLGRMEPKIKKNYGDNRFEVDYDSRNEMKKFVDDELKSRDIVLDKKTKSAVINDLVKDVIERKIDETTEAELAKLRANPVTNLGAREAGWKSADHPTTSGIHYPDGMNEEERRNLYYADSVATEVLKNLVIDDAIKDLSKKDRRDYLRGVIYEDPGMYRRNVQAEIRHNYTNYDDLWRQFNNEIAKGRESGAFTGYDYAKGLSMEPYFDWEPEDWYGTLFRGPVMDKLDEAVKGGKK